MKLILVIYAVLGLIFTPLIYSNNANEYRSGTTGMKIGLALAGGLYWPSYLFSLEPEVDGKSFENFEASLLNIVEYRNDKLFTGTRTPEHGKMVLTAIGSCAALEGAGNFEDAYKMVFTKEVSSDDVKRIRAALMNRMDGHDFLDVVKEGRKCQDELLKNKAKPIKSTNSIVTVPAIDGRCDDVDNIVKAAGLEPKRVDVHGPDDKDAAGIGCAYRQDPKAGESVPKGSTLTYRSWFEGG